MASRYRPSQAPPHGESQAPKADSTPSSIKDVPHGTQCHLASPLLSASVELVQLPEPNRSPLEGGEVPLSWKPDVAWRFGVDQKPFVWLQNCILLKQPGVLTQTELMRRRKTSAAEYLQTFVTVGISYPSFAALKSRLLVNGAQTLCRGVRCGDFFWVDAEILPGFCVKFLADEDDKLVPLGEAVEVLRDSEYNMECHLLLEVHGLQWGDNGEGKSGKEAPVHASLALHRAHVVGGIKVKPYWEAPDASATRMVAR